MYIHYDFGRARTGHGHGGDYGRRDMNYRVQNERGGYAAAGVRHRTGWGYRLVANLFGRGKY